MPARTTQRPRSHHHFRHHSLLACALSITPLSACIAQSPTPDFYQNFQNPSDDSRPMMRWWWFGSAVTDDELARELEQMHSAGIGGVEIQPVYPLSVDDPAKGIKNLPYLSPPFLDAVTFANTKARSLGMRVDITLGSGWPYGGPHTTLANAAGRFKVVAIPISVASVNLPQLAEGESFIAAFQVSGTPKAYDAATAKRLDLAPNTSTVVSTPSPGQTALFFIASHTKQTVKRPAVGAEGLVLDHFSRAAINAHLTEVATPLLSAFGTTPPTSVFSDSLEVYGADWTPNLLTEFQRRRGYDLLPHLPELDQGGSKEAEAVRHDWGLTLSELINENYLAIINSFAQQHHTSFRSQTYGEPAVTLANESTPALPEGEGPQWRTFSFTRWASSASHLYGRNITSAETWTWLHSPAFRATPLDMKVEADRMFLLGVNQIVGHGWPYSPAKVADPGWSLYAAAVFNAHNPWWPVMPDIVSYLHRASWLLRQGQPANDVAILLPEDDAQAAFTPGHVSVTDEMKKRITPELMSTILDAGYNVDYTDAATINRLGVHHPILLLPPTDRIPLSTATKLTEYVSGGGYVVALGKRPSLAPGLREQSESAKVSALMHDLFARPDHRAVLIPSLDQLPDTLHHALAPDLKAVSKPSTSATDPGAGLGFIHRKLPNADVYFVVNSTNQPMSTSLTFRARHEVLQEWSLEDGKLLATRGSGPLPLTLAPYQSIAIVLSMGGTRPGASGITSQQPQRDGQPGRPATSSLNSSGSEPSISRSAEATQPLATLDTDWSVTFPGKASQTLPGLGSWTKLPKEQFFSGEAVYAHTLLIAKGRSRAGQTLLDFGPGTPTTDTRPSNAPGIHANLDPPIREAATIFINGQRAGSLWHPPYQIDISKFVHDGENRIEVHVFNTAINELAGQPPRDYSALEARYGRRFVPQDMDHLQPLPSGILGPVTILQQSGSSAKIEAK